MLYGRVSEPGVTDRSPGIDGYGMVRGYLDLVPMERAQRTMMIGSGSGHAPTMITMQMP